MSDPKPRAKRAPKSAVATTETVLVTRYVRADMTAYGGFRWPESGPVEATDWKATKQCGNGLHGWLYGQGDHACTDKWQTEGARWLVVEVDSDSIIELGGKVKFPACVVRFVGDAKSATDYLLEHEPRSRDVAVIGACRAEKQDGARVSVGALGTATAGYSGTATAGDRGTATAGLYGVISILYYDNRADAYRRKAGEIDGEKLKPGVAYRLDDKNEFTPAKSGD